MKKDRKEDEKVRSLQVQWVFIVLGLFFAFSGGLAVNALYELLRTTSSVLFVFTAFGLLTLFTLDVLSFFFERLSEIRNDPNETLWHLLSRYFKYRLGTIKSLSLKKTERRYATVVLKIIASTLGIVGLLMGALHVLVAVFGLGGMDPSFSVSMGILIPLIAEVLALIALGMLWWRPHLAAWLYAGATVLFFGALLLFCVVFAHVKGLELVVALFTTPHNVFILPAWLPLLFAGGIASS